MSEIKLKNTVKDIKILDKTSNLSKNMRNSYIRTKEKAEETQQNAHDNPQGYATDNVFEKGEIIGTKVANKTEQFGRNSFKNTPQNIRGAKNSFVNAKNEIKTASNEFKKAKSEIKTAFKGAKNKTIKQRGISPLKTVKQSARSVDKTIKTTAKGTIKTTDKSIKTAQSTAKAAVKTSQTTAKVAAKTAQATAKTAQKAAQVAKVTAKATIATAKATAKAVVATVKAIIAAVKGLVSLIAAGGWVAVVVILVICLVAMIAGSCFGIFFSGEDTGTGMTMQTAVREINADYENKIDEIKKEQTFDVLEISGSRAIWKEVLAIYAVKTTTDPKHGQEVASINENKIKMLKSIFWQMNDLSWSTKTKTETIIETSDDGNGNIVEKEVTVTRKYLYITVSHKTADEMANEYKFNTSQRQQLSELLSDEYSGLWSSVLYGISSGSGNGDIVGVALSQVGNIGGQPYWSWYGFGGRVEWCACFVSWVANECGYVESGVIPKFAACTSQGMPWFKERGQWQDKNYEPRSGDIIFFDWDNSGDADHVGIVQKCENGVVYTIEGNSGDACRQRSYPVGSNVIKGYGVPAY